MKETKVPVYLPLIENEELEAIHKSSADAWFGSGQHVKELEKMVEGVIGNPNKHAVAVSTCTTGIHLALLLCDLNKGDEVIVSSLNFVGVTQAVIQTGATPVFCDVIKETLCPDPDSVEKLINEKTKVIITLDYGSNFCDHDRFEELRKKYGLRMIHDAAHSFGWEYKSKPIGSFGDLCVFSFDPVKNFTCIDGGMVITSSEDEKKWLIEARTVGQSFDVDTFGKNKKMNFKQVDHIGFRYHLSNVHAALGKIQIGKKDIIGNSRREVCTFYNNAFSDLDEVTPISKSYDNVIPFIYIVKVPEDKRDDLRDYLSEKGVETHVHWMPLYYYNFLKNVKVESKENSSVVGNQILTLPLHSKMKKNQYEKVIYEIKQFFNNSSN